MILKSFIFVSLIIALSSGQTPQKWGPNLASLNPHPSKIYKINVQDTYKQRWAQVMKDHKEKVIKLVNIAKEYYAPTGTEDIPENAIYSYDKEFFKEISAIAELLGVPVTSVFWLNVMYEAFAFCTSVIIQDKNDYIFHGRNLDYAFGEQFADVTITIDFYKNETLAYRASVLAGFVGFITVEKPGKFSISANQRTSRYVHKTSENRNLNYLLGRGINLFELFYNKRSNIFLAIRDTVMNSENFQEAVTSLSNARLIAPVYFIVAGVKPNEGAVISRNRDGVFSIDKLDAEKGVWYLVQTNYDRDLPDPKNDQRRIPAENRIKEIGRDKITPQNLLDKVLAVYPNFNNGTIVSVLYSAASDYFNATVWL